jgi:hypothetical protein
MQGSRNADAAPIELVAPMDIDATKPIVANLCAAARRCGDTGKIAGQRLLNLFLGLTYERTLRIELRVL